ncbi:MAG TPA: hypothetical protein RMH99_28990 [Sandaracinaceae bacterium LLY-WYZ-13_1]|nr:hypothetical protein [Sandaracinaceae bacterium LLY-WYZ-13_1]
MRQMKPLLAIVSLLCIAGCGGSAASANLPDTRLSYNEAVVRSSNEQLLLNLVRLRYLHAPQFFEVTAVTTQSAVTQGGNASVGGNFGNNLVNDSIFTPFATVNVGGSVQVEDRPTVSYQPLQGEAFAERMVRPIRPETLLLLLDVGWRIDRLLACCVQRVNEVGAPVIASRSERFGGDRFRRVGQILYELQMRQSVEVNVAEHAGHPQLYLTFVPGPDDERFERQLGELQALLELDPSRRSYRVLASHAVASREEAAAAEASGEEADEVGDEADEADEGAAEADASEEEGAQEASATAAPAPAGADGRDYIVMRGRSLLGALFYLSHGVSVPATEASARSLDYNDLDGELVEVGQTVDGALLAIRHSAERPEDAYVRTRYRGRWFSIADADLRSKQTFLLLQVLFSVLSASDGGGPLLTLPVGA